MLIITRKAHERLVIGDEITVEVLEVAGNSVRLGIAAPRSLPVYREEIWAAVKEENQAAAEADADRLTRPRARV